MRRRLKNLSELQQLQQWLFLLVPTTVFAEEPVAAIAEETAKNDNLLRVWYDEPATDWQTQSLAIGNGYMGSLVFGGINKDKIHINEKTVWEGNRQVIMAIAMVQQTEQRQMQIFRRSKMI